MDNLTTRDVFQGNTQLEKLVEELEGTFPSFLPTPSYTLTDIMFRSGQRSVVEYLKTKIET
tara:strand:- start:38 stop:220 length:183 start_codon:yes stop_codon:yes gene_type:complete